MNYWSTRSPVVKTELTEDEIQFIMANTDFERDKIIAWFEKFKQKCPDCRFDRAAFVEFYKNLIPGESYEEERFCEYVFQAFDTDRNGFIDFSEFLISFWVRAKGNLREKLGWLFDVYDMDHNGHISNYELTRILGYVLKMKNSKENVYDKARSVFQTLDRSKDGIISKSEFIAGCTKDEEMRKLFSPF